MSTRRVILRNVASNWIGYVASAVVALFLSPFVVHTLGDSSYGIWTLVVSVTGYYGLFDLGIRSAVGQYVTRYWAQGDMDGVNRTINTAFVALAAIAVPVAGATVVLAVLLPRLFDIDPGYAPQAQGALLIFGLRVAAGLPLAMYGAVTTARQRFDISNAIGIVNSLVSAGLIVLLLPRYGILGLAVTTAIVAVLDWVASVWVAHRLMPGLVFSPRRSSWMAIKEIGHYGIFSFVSRIAAQVIYQTDAIVIGIFMPLGAITYYAIGANLLPYLSRIISGMVHPLTPVATSADATGDRQQLRRLFLVGTRGTFLVACFVGGGMIFLGHDFLKLWMGAKYVSGEVYTSSAVILTILAAAALVRMLQSCGLQILFGMRHVRFLALLSGCEAIANLGLSLMLVKPFGLVGVAVGTLVPQVISQGFIQPVFLLRRLDIRWRTYLTQAPVGGLATMAAMGLVYALAQPFFPASDWAGFLIKGLVVSGPAALIGILVGTTTSEKRNLLGHMGLGRRQATVPFSGQRSPAEPTSDMHAGRAHRPMGDLLYHAAYYREASVFKKDYWTACDQRRLETVCAMIPTGASSILDIGSGRGLIVKAMRARGYRVIASDCSEVALTLYDGERVCCGCDRLPFGDRSFDMVTCTEVLEHLDDHLCAAALQEMARVASAYVLISVPNQENLAQSMMRCHACGQFYTMYGHVRTFGASDMVELLPSFAIVREQLGDWRVEYNRLLLWVRQHLGRTWAYWELATCPRCGAAARKPVKRNPVTLACDFFNNRIPWRPRRKTPLCVLYRRKKVGGQGCRGASPVRQCSGSQDDGFARML